MGERASSSRAGKASYDGAFYALAAATAIAIVFTIHYVFLVVPEQETMGIVQKIFYFHVPSAVTGMYLGAVICFVGSGIYLVRGSLRADAWARAGADVAVAMGFMVLISGPLWAKKAWGAYWTWDAQLTTSLLSVLIYVAYVVLRTFTGGGDAERKFAAALGVLGAANLPIIHWSVKKWGGTHPTVIREGGEGLGHPAMTVGLMLGFLSFALLSFLLAWARARQHAVAMRVDAAEEEALVAGVVEDS
jgi:heme exporter protein C